MKYKNNIEAVAKLQPDYMGFIFYNKSSRFFESNIPQISESIKKTGVFVNDDIETVKQLVKKHNLKAIQLHGSETPEYCEILKAFFHSEHNEESSKLNEIFNHVQHDNQIEIIKVFSIKDSFNFNELKPYEGIVDYFLFDTKGKLPGGNGYTFNWDVLKNYPSTTPYFLSGGIGLNETKKIKEFKKNPASKFCCAIDVNSKFEIEPGLKNEGKLKEFIQQLAVSS